MSEYIVTVSIQRSARGEGDTPVVAAARSEAIHYSGTPEGKAEKIADVVDRIGDRVLKDLRQNGVHV